MDARGRVQALRATAYTRDLALLKQIGSDYKLVEMRCVRTRGVELDDPPAKGSVNKDKLANNVVRARSKVRDYGLCNPWEYFLTLTINGAFLDRYDHAQLRRVLSQWVRDYRKRYGCDVKYLLIPEQHEDGAWHLHGFLMGLPKSHLVPFTLQERLPVYIRTKLKQGQPIYNWPAYAARFGHVTVEPIRDQARAVSYITKYITKDLSRSVSRLGAHLYYASQGLQKAQELKRGTLVADMQPDFENEYCRLQFFDGAQYQREELESRILSRREQEELCFDHTAGI